MSDLHIAAHGHRPEHLRFDRAQSRTMAEKPWQDRVRPLESVTLWATEIALGLSMGAAIILGMALLNHFPELADALARWLEHA